MAANCAAGELTQLAPFPQISLGLGNGRDQSIDGLSYGRIVRLVALRGDGGELALVREQNPYGLGAIEKREDGNGAGGEGGAMVKI